MSFYRGTGDVDAGTEAGRVLRSQNNLSDVANAATARSNLGLSGVTGASTLGFSPTGTIAAANVQDAIAEAASEALQKSSNLSDIANVVTARSNLGLTAAGGAALIGYTPTGTVAAGTVQSAIDEVVSDLAASSGSSLVGFLQSGTGATSRISQEKMREAFSVKDFGAVGDGSTNDTVAISNAIAAAIAAEKSLYFPEGIYITSGSTYSSNSANIKIFGAGSGVTTIKNNINTSPAFTITASTGTPNQIVVDGITFQGNGTPGSTSGTNTSAISVINLVHGTFLDCYFVNAKYGIELLGGINISFIDCYAYYNSEIGFRAYQSGASGYPNIIKIKGGGAKNNGLWGVYFDQGRLLTVDDCDIEGNGVGSAAATICGGVYNGSEVGIENGATAGPGGGVFESLGVVVRNCWFENNGISGTGNSAQIVSNHGKIVVLSSLMTACPTDTYVRVNGGNYTVEDCSFETPKTYYIDEGATSGISGIYTGNYVRNCTVNGVDIAASNCRVDETKTTFDGAYYGTWTPTITFATPGNLSVTYSVQWGQYKKVGKRVLLDGAILTSAFTHTTASGNLAINGLPFTPATVTNAFWIGTLHWQGITNAAYTNVVTQIGSAGTSINLIGCGSGTTSAGITAADMPTGGTVKIRFQIEYQT